MTKSLTLFRRTLLGSALLLSPVAASHCWAGQQPPIVLQIPAGSLDAALRAVGRQTGREIMYSADVVAGKRAPRLAERLTADEAIKRLLSGTNLEAEFRPDVVIIRTRSAAAATEGDPANSGQVVVTGSRTKGGGINPVRTTTRARAEAEGFGELGSLARSLTENFTGGQNPGVIGSGQKGAENIVSSTTLNLRGLGSDATLTLINGHRVANESASQGTDISAIPLIAVERLELLPDGSSALYGSDAVAGVANIVLRSPFDGTEARARLAVPTRGGGVQDQYSILAGTTWAHGGLIVALDYLHVDPITADQRSFTRTLDPSATVIPSQKQYSGILAAQQELSSRLEFVLDAQFNRRSTGLAAPFLSPGDVRTNGAVSARSVRSFAVAPGFNLDLGRDWTVKASGVHSENTVRVHVFNYASGRESSRVLAIYHHQLDTAEAGAEGPVFRLPGGDARLALGAGWRRAAFDGDINAVIGGLPRTTLNLHEHYTIGFAYAEATLPLVSATNARPGISALRFNGAIRYEHYSSLGGVAVPKVGIRYDPVPGLSIRANWGKSFKVPTLSQSGAVVQGLLVPARAYVPGPPGGGNVISLNGGGIPLRPERARTWTAGLVLTPFSGRDVRFEATYFNIDYRDRVLKPIPTETTAFSAIYADFITAAPTLAQVTALVASLPQGLTNQTGAPVNLASVTAIIDNRLKNVARQRAQGVDVTAHAGVPLGPQDRLSFDGALSYLESDQQFSPLQPVIPRAGTIFDPPYWRGRASLGWQGSSVGLVGSASYIGGTTDNRFTPTTEVNGFTAFDLVATVRFRASRGPLSGATLSLAALNVLDAAPSRIRTTSAANPPFDTTNYPSTGRVVALTIAKRW